MKASSPNKKLYSLLCSVLAGLSMLSPLPARASLGDDLQSIQVDQLHLKASLEITETQTYRVHEMKSATGTVVREYVSRADGRVFGIAWQGPFIPDLKLLLGSYFQLYSQAAKTQRESQVGVHPLNIREARLVVQTAGHLRAYSGRAYDPGLLPSGVNANDIR